MTKEAESVNTEATMQDIAASLNDLSTKLSKLGVESVITDPGIDEFWKGQIGNLFNNAKRTYDEYQNVSLDGTGKNRVHFDKTVTDAQESDNRKRNIADQALQNAVETANMVSKQAVRHGDIAIDRQWNVDEQAGFVAKILNSIQDPAVAAAMAVAVAEAMLNKNK